MLSCLFDIFTVKNMTFSVLKIIIHSQLIFSLFLSADLSKLSADHLNYLFVSVHLVFLKTD